RACPREPSAPRLASLFVPGPRNVLCHRSPAISPRPKPRLVTISAPMWLDVKKCLAVSLALPAALACSPRASQGTASAPGADPPPAPVTNPRDAAPTAASDPGAEHLPAQERARGVMPDTPPDPTRSWPEGTVRNVGLHLGGGSNDAASKEPFQRAIA